MSQTERSWWCRAVGAFGVLAFVGCAGLEPPSATPRPITPQLAEVELVHTVYFDTDDARLTQAESEALRRFAQQVDTRLALDQIVIGHADVRGSDAHNDPLSERRAATVARLLEAEGFPSELISSHGVGRRFPVTSEENELSWRLSRRVVVLARGIVVIEPSCPDWSRPGAAHPANLPTSNFGCATTVNLIRMMADPRDLVRGQAHRSGDGTRAAAAVERQRADDVKPLIVEGASR
jgi:type IV pilus biogenesis protein CpaD/CtpE